MPAAKTFPKSASVEDIHDVRRVYSTDHPDVFYTIARDGKTRYTQTVTGNPPRVFCNCPAYTDSCWHAVLVLKRRHSRR